jgi:hypothetical protein
MAIPKIKGTYTLDTETVRALEGMARRWGVSKSEALRRAIQTTAQQSTLSQLEALNKLQKSLNLTPARARAWVRRSRAERRASSERLERGGR